MAGGSSTCRNLSAGECCKEGEERVLTVESLRTKREEVSPTEPGKQCRECDLILSCE